MCWIQTTEYKSDIIERIIQSVNMKYCISQQQDDNNFKEQIQQDLSDFQNFLFSMRIIYYFLKDIQKLKCFTYLIQKIFKMNMMHAFQQHQPIHHVVSPMVVGSSVIGLKCKQGVILATDTLLSYGSLLKYTDICRYEKITDNVVIAATGQYADFQEVSRRLKALSRQSDIFDDKVNLSVKDYANYLAKMCYVKRNNMNPYYNNIVIAGFDKNEPYLGSVDLYGNFIVKDYVVTGFSKHYGLALIANEWNPNKTAEQCKAILRKCFEVIYLRDCHSVDKVQFTLVTNEGVKIQQAQKIPSSWDLKQFRERANEKLWQ